MRLHRGIANEQINAFSKLLMDLNYSVKISLYIDNKYRRLNSNKINQKNLFKKAVYIISVSKVKITSC